jgi:ATP-dependent DNA helicase PIF1
MRKFIEIKTIKKYIDEDQNIFITGSGGTGKSTSLYEIRKYLSEIGKRFKVTAPTGIAAINVKGITLHSFVGLGLAEKDKETLYAITKANKNLYKRWVNLDVLIIDEISMVDIDFFKKLNYIAKNIRDKDEIFGGIQIILIGDFFQLPPVNKSSENEEYLFETKLWKNMNLKIIELTKNMRQDNIQFFNILNEIRRGYISDKNYQILKKCEGKKF